MVRRRIGYGMALAAALLFQICFTGYLSYFILALALCFPFLSLGLSLPGVLGCTLVVSPRAHAVERGGIGQWDIRVQNRTGLPLARLSLSVETENRLTGEQVSVRRTLTGASAGKSLHESFEALHCGQIACTASRARACDLLGLFTLSLPIRTEGTLYSLPRRVPTLPPPEIPGGRNDGTGLKPRPGGGPGEDYDLRPYRPGDPMRSVHWKLSSKLDELVVRETLEPRLAALVLTYDHFGSPDALDASLDRLCAASRLLLAKERLHFIQWAEPNSGIIHTFPIANERDLADALTESLSTYAPRNGKSILDTPIRVTGDGPVRHLHITPTDGGEGGGL